ncbi:hypothetical protein NDU88_010372 [Pleurodeles waltl]|uniref:Uncharacterized protein n=1 Tax=Pleurodeles waltl TaxID=8319 RepID=A0AAV7PUQ1_PLEWA|nr:hypothetical protein NDU88_010372 [Pleurodeles waltl]
MPDCLAQKIPKYLSLLRITLACLPNPPQLPDCVIACVVGNGGTDADVVVDEVGTVFINVTFVVSVMVLFDGVAVVHKVVFVDTKTTADVIDDRMDDEGKVIVGLLSLLSSTMVLTIHNVFVGYFDFVEASSDIDLVFKEMALEGVEGSDLESEEAFFVLLDGKYLP